MVAVHDKMNYNENNVVEHNKSQLNQVPMAIDDLLNPNKITDDVSSIMNKGEAKL
jgi:hypothetical protein